MTNKNVYTNRPDTINLHKTGVFWRLVQNFGKKRWVDRTEPNFKIKIGIISSIIGQSFHENQCL